MPKLAWWTLFETSLKHILEICEQLLSIYKSKSIEWKELKTIMDSAYEKNDIKDPFVLDKEKDLLEKNLQKEKEEEEKMKS